MQTSSSMIKYGGVFSVDGTRNLVCYTSDEQLIWCPMTAVSDSSAVTNSNGLLEGLSQVSGVVTLPLRDCCVLNRTGPRSFAVHVLQLHDKDPSLARVHARHEFSLVGSYKHLPSPAQSSSSSSDDDEPVSGWVRELKSEIYRVNGDPTARAPVLVLINPFSGTKKGSLIWSTECAPILQEAGLKSNVVETTKAGNAYDIVKEMRLGSYSAIAAVGGDGILNEVINGLMSRPDWTQAIQIPIAPVAAGTGNATVYSLYNTTSAACVACHIVRNATRKSDIFLASQPTLREYMWGILDCEYGIVAEADFGSERIRWLGSARPAVWALYRILCGTFYRCKLTYLTTDIPRASWYNVKCTRDCQYCKHALAHEDIIVPENQSNQSPNSDEEQAPEEANSTPAVPSPSTSSAPSEESAVHVDSASSSSASEKSTSQNEGSEKQSIVHRPVPQRIQQQAVYGPAYTMSLTPTSDWIDDVPTSYAHLFNNFEHYHLGGSLPSGWTTLDNMNLCFCTFQKLPWLMPGMLVAPFSHQSDGCMDLCYVTSEAFSRAAFMKFFGSFSEGSHVYHPKLNYVKVKSFTLEPLDQEGYVGIDGERCKFAPIQFYVAQGLVNLLQYC